MTVNDSFRIELVEAPRPRAELQSLAVATFGDMVKAVVDVQRRVIAIGGELHADLESFLLEKNSVQANLWGINLYPSLPLEEWIEFDSMINLRPSQNNRSRSVDDRDLRQKISEIVNELFTS